MNTVTWLIKWLYALLPNILSNLGYTTGGGTGTGTSGAANPIVNTSVGAHVISSPEFASREYIVTGLTADGPHTTPSAAAIIAAFSPALALGSSFRWEAVNMTVFTLTLIAGTGITFVGSAVVDTSTAVEYLVTITDATNAVFTRLFAKGVGA